MKIHDYAREGDIAGVLAELELGVDIDARDKESYTPLMRATRSAEAGIDMLRLLIERGANVGASHETIYEYIEGKEVLNVIRIAVQSGNREKVETLLTAGATLNSVEENGHDVFWDAIVSFGGEGTSDDIEYLEFLIERGARPDFVWTEGDMALQTASNIGRFDIVEFLLNRGADAQYLEWTELMFAIALGTVQDMEALLKKGVDLEARDIEDRTAWHLSIVTGDRAKCQLLLDHGVDKNQAGFLGCSPLNYAIDFGRMDMLQWLLDIGVDIEGYGELKMTPLCWAVAQQHVDAVRVLLAAGADRYGARANIFLWVQNLEIFELFLEAGEDFNNATPEIRRLLIGLGPGTWHDVPSEAYLRDKLRRFGTANPEVMNLDFWISMVRSGSPSDGIRTYYDDLNFDEGPIWTYTRFGKSLTPLPDGRYIEIAGENEDSYDSNFCIYNDVFVHYGDGKFDILGYPREVFPPTDFHTATLVGKWIYIVGCLGYPEQRIPEETPVYRLNTDTYVIEKVETTGNKPGWISRHTTILTEDNKLLVCGGKVIQHNLSPEQKQLIEENTEARILMSLGAIDNPDYVWNEKSFVLDLETLIWSRVEENRLIQTR